MRWWPSVRDPQLSCCHFNMDVQFLWGFLWDDIFATHCACRKTAGCPLLWKRGQPQGTNPQLGCDLLHLPTSYVECSDGWGQLSFSPLHPMQQSWIQVQPRHIPSTTTGHFLKYCTQALRKASVLRGGKQWACAKISFVCCPPFFLEESF